jgi:hypothetical protein
MIWNKKAGTVGDRKTETCFAWFPVQLDEPEYCVVWLTNYKRDIVYSEYGWDNIPYAWTIRKKYLCKNEQERPGVEP